MYGLRNTTLIISNDDMKDLIKIVTLLEEHDVLLKRTSKTIKNKTKKQKVGFLSMLLGTLIASLLGNYLLERDYIELVKECTELENECTKQVKDLKRINSISSINKF